MRLCCLLVQSLCLSLKHGQKWHRSVAQKDQFVRVNHTLEMISVAMPKLARPSRAFPNGDLSRELLWSFSTTWNLHFFHCSVKERSVSPVGRHGSRAYVPGTDGHARSRPRGDERPRPPISSVVTSSGLHQSMDVDPSPRDHEDSHHQHHQHHHHSSNR